MKSLAAYKRENKIYLRPMSESKIAWIGTDPVIVIEKGESASRKGTGVREALGYSQQGVPHPANWRKEVIAPFLKAVGVSSYSKFAKSACCCDVDLEGDQLRFTPYRNLGPREGYEPIPDRRLFLS
ncbi:MAG: hypothetical protein V2B18_13650, partial [Pseudomonadota bacterium]